MKLAEDMNIFTVMQLNNNRAVEISHMGTWPSTPSEIPSAHWGLDSIESELNDNIMRKQHTRRKLEDGAQPIRIR
jgi:hypothetical protein